MPQPPPSRRPVSAKNRSPISCGSAAPPLLATRRLLKSRAAMPGVFTMAIHMVGTPFICVQRPVSIASSAASIWNRGCSTSSTPLAIVRSRTAVSA